MTATFLDLVDLASERLGAAVVAANDEFFAPKENLIKQAPPIWREGEYTERGKWMDGWETRRRRAAGDHDWCIIRLGAPGIVRGVDVDTAFFRGNYPEACAIDLGVLRPFDELRVVPSEVEGRQAQDERFDWREALARTPLTGDSHNLFAIGDEVKATHVRLRIYPDGGVARLRVHGDVVPDWERLRRRDDVDLAAVEHGGFVVACSDMFFGSRHNLIMPGDATHMGDGWETKRRRGPDKDRHDWTIIRLGTAGTIRRIEIDTRHFKGNAPGACSLDALRLADDAVLAQGETLRLAQGAALVQGKALEEADWRELLPKTPLEPHARHTFEDQVQAISDVTHVRFNIFPDGGVGRLRLYGRPRP